MLLTTQGLVLHTTPYSDSSLIANVFTRELGLKSYIVKGIGRSQKAPRRNLLQPLSHLEMTVYNNPRKEVQYVKEIHSTPTPRAYQTTSLTAQNLANLKFFACELLYRSLSPDQPNQSLFDYTTQSLGAIDLQSNSVAHFPIRYMLGLAEHLGIQPLDDYSPNTPHFDLREGHFTQPARHNETAQYHVNADLSLMLHHYLSGNTPQCSFTQRSALLNTLLDYYNIHLPNFNTFNSANIIHEILHT
ncbi:MAG: DNA repair protein RecO [Bacteroidales bacterium]|nr:DNA repair protein RecO [Bacteroidales bacterium]